jgi:predicted alpha/beta-fold hydrolase
MLQVSIPDFVPHPLLRGGHRQTVAGAYLWRRPAYQALPHRVVLPDGDQLVLHDDCPDPWRPGERIALLVHGLAGGHGSGYMARIADKLARRGNRVFRLDQRGCGAGVELARQTFHAGRTEDLLATIQFIQQISPDSPIILVGFSLGASIVLKLIGTSADQLPSQVSAAIAVAPPIDLEECSRRIGQGLNRAYDRKFVKNLMNYVQQRVAVMPDSVPATLQPSPKSLYEFDARFTAPLGGFASVEDYYRRCSAGNDLKKIELPTCILTSADDPLVPVQSFHDAEYSAATRLFVTQGGGHLGYLGRTESSADNDDDWHWMDWRVVQWVEATR